MAEDQEVRPHQPQAAMRWPKTTTPVVQIGHLRLAPTHCFQVLAPATDW
ncbi:MAG: hypothetical protein ACLQOO_16360 [Terriglobia bacterium]